MKPADVIGRDGILILEQAMAKGALLTALAHRLASRMGNDERVLLGAILKREELGSTGIGEGVALPHARLESADAPRGVLAILRRPVDFQAIDGRPVDLIAMLALPEAGTGVALQALSGLSRCLRQPNIRDQLRAARDEAEAYEALCSV